ncbi:NAD(P) transhydrogenase subunit alpha [Actinoplanes oblitus]|uniref:proton-translocating NAD(P)(+) transhydrogenase n=1 Tax=Actinoplanes oblitus TaxID=3040509 RepID=A0ABY8W752_9ACTN|nr:NAD(P) transhydrogenase subunit alpha [Actinoplanes oblitus]WIM92847.1 NAD(P) transhydrogenase subunit alpha [Actinoplanes oblitus]
MTTVGVLRETADHERRVALTPDAVRRLRERGTGVLVESEAGARAWFGDEQYRAAGAELGDRDRVYAGSDVLTCLAPPADADRLRRGQTLIGLLAPLAHPEPAGRLAAAGVTAISLDLLPRTLSRAQPMDALTSQANVAGYKAAIVAAEAYGGYFPLLMTAAGTVRPAQVLVLGAGVAGLQAIATARRLGAVVTGYDVRPQARADIVSTGAAVLEAGHPVAASGDGYARALTEQESAEQQRALQAAVARFDVVITTAQVPGRRPPVLVPAATLAAMRPGSVVVDLAAGPDGGNVEGSVAGTTALIGGVTLIAAGNLAATMPQAASTAYAKNLLALLAVLTPEPDLGDEIQAAVTVTHAGRVVHPAVRQLLEGAAL